MQTPLIAWLMAFMVTTAPPGRKTYIPQAEETKDEAMLRYDSIAHDIQTVLLNPQERVITTGKYARIRMASIILSVMLHESGFRKDVDYGLGKHARGDNGRSWCLMQINIGDGRTRPWNKVYQRFAIPGDPPDQLEEGYTGPQLVQDRKLCIQTGLRTIVATVCKSKGPLGYLRAYASGSCSKGGAASKARMSTAIHWFNGHRPSFTDQDLWALMAPKKLPTEVSLLEIH